jgi:predicted alpha-1,6-mannanase (GH76 family)
MSPKARVRLKLPSRCGLLLGALAVACGADAPAAPGAALGGASTAAGSGGASATASGAGGAQNNAGQSSSGMSSSGASLGGTESNNAGSGGAVSGAGGAGQGPGLPMFPALLQGCDIPAAHQHADRALAVNLLDFWNGSQQYLNAVAPTDGKLTGYWTYAQVFDALLDGVERTGSLHYRGLVRTFYDGRAARGWLVDYYDDEAWMTMALLRAYDLTADSRYLDTAETIYKDIMTQWDTTCCGTHLGGIWWDKKKTQKATASNAGPVIAGVRLAKRTNKPEYLDFAKQAYAFWMSDMVDQKSWAIFDHLSPDGSRGPGALSYNHGLMIGAGLELNAATGEAHYLAESHDFAHYMITNAVRPSSAGPVLNDFGTNCEGDCAAWKGIGYRYLALLFQKDPTHQDYATLLSNDATAIWTLARDPATDHFGSIWSGPPPSTGGVEKQGSAAMALNLYALLCGSDPNAAPPAAGQYEAEEATLNHVALEAMYQGFSGFGYVAAFDKDKQSLTFEVEVAKAGAYSLEWTYAAGAGAATRSVLVAGQAVVAAQAFAATPDWSSWASAKSTLDLAQGANLIELRYDAAKGGAASLNVDKLELTAL